MSNAAYLIMDLVNDLVHEDGPNGGTLGREVRRRGVLEHTARALARARAAGLLVAFVRVGFDPDAAGRDCSMVSPLFKSIAAAGILKLGTWGTQVHDAVKPRSGEVDVVKHRVSPFYGTSLEAVLRGNRIERLFLSGVSTNFVVSSAVREAHDRDYEVVVLEECCAAASEAEHRQSIEGFRGLCQKIARVDEAF